MVGEGVMPAKKDGRGKGGGLNGDEVDETEGLGESSATWTGGGGGRCNAAAGGGGGRTGAEGGGGGL